MPSYQGRDLLLKIGDGGTPQEYTTIGAARSTSLRLANDLQETTAVQDSAATFSAAAGAQAMQVTLEGLFCGAAAEELLRAAAFGREIRSYRLIFPNGDDYTADFAVESYGRGGSRDGFETFSLSLVRSGTGVYRPGGA